MSQKRSAEDFKSAVASLGLSQITISECSMCGYSLKYFFRGDHVYFDSGCYCVNDGPRIEERSWQAVADFYNTQSSQTIIDNLNSVFGFSSLAENDQ